MDTRLCSRYRSAVRILGDITFSSLKDSKHVDIPATEANQKTDFKHFGIINEILNYYSEHRNSFADTQN